MTLEKKFDLEASASYITTYLSSRKPWPNASPTDETDL